MDFIEILCKRDKFVIFEWRVIFQLFWIRKVNAQFRTFNTSVLNYFKEVKDEQPMKRTNIYVIVNNLKYTVANKSMYFPIISIEEWNWQVFTKTYAS